MKSVGLIKNGDRVTTLLLQANELIDGKVCIGDAIDLLHDVVLVKRHFYDFYGEASKEYKVATVFINIIRMIKRSMEHQKECYESTLMEWVEKQPLRMTYIARLQHALSKFN